MKTDKRIGIKYARVGRKKSQKLINMQHVYSVAQSKNASHIYQQPPNRRKSETMFNFIIGLFLTIISVFGLGIIHLLRKQNFGCLDHFLPYLSNSTQRLKFHTSCQSVY